MNDYDSLLVSALQALPERPSTPYVEHLTQSFCTFLRVPGLVWPPNGGWVALTAVRKVDEEGDRISVMLAVDNPGPLKRELIDANLEQLGYIAYMLGIDSYTNKARTKSVSSSCGRFFVEKGRLGRTSLSSDPIYKRPITYALRTLREEMGDHYMYEAIKPGGVLYRNTNIGRARAVALTLDPGRDPFDQTFLPLLQCHLPTKDYMRIQRLYAHPETICA
jgi:hypothetical protein